MIPQSRVRPIPAQADPRSGGAPRIVAIGGGTGLPNVLRGLRPLLFPDGATDASRDRLVAVVATSDDGGSSGRLRAEFNMIPPGDIRNCLAALSASNSDIADIFQYRFETGEGLNGHAIGNLLIAALTDVTRDFAQAVDAAARMLGVCGVVLPATSELVTLVAEFTDGRVLSGETAIARAGGTIGRLSLLPERPACSVRVVDAIRRADVIVAGPGSLYTSILPPLLVPDVTAAVLESRAIRVLVANLMTEAGETDNFSVLDHLLTIERHLGRQLFDCVIFNTMPVPEALTAAYGERGASPIVTGSFELNALQRFGVRALGVPLVSEHPAGKIRHHPERLAAAITAVAHGKLGAFTARAEVGGI
ncbi:MAG TPA: uridine diphosphate-N-acetylglucosamine-binding protein YvcK [Vicinamibacterales bacterium]|nr:uridine diphosphate-N-acetylglucosamine-binding protein YvcK [Vicinamibacterales bacterium]